MVIPEFGAPDVFELRDVAVPEPGPGEVSIDVRFSSVNFTDVRNRRGDGLGVPPMIPGIEVAGPIRGLGAGVEELSVGQEVVALCGGHGYAEVAISDARRVVPVPQPLIGAPVSCTTIGVVPSAINLLRAAGRVQPDETMLCHGASGGVGTALAQLVGHYGLGPVYGTVGRADKVDYAMSKGYADVFARDGFVDAVLAATGGRGVDVVFDPIGGEVRARSFEALADFGRLVHFGNASLEPEVVPPAVDLRARALGYIGYSGGQHAVRNMEEVRKTWVEGVELVGSGVVSLDVTATFPLEQAADAHRLLESGTATGKIVLTL
jgi:NADPH2:quinone reductase